MAQKTLTIYEAKWTAAKRAAYYKAHPENFAGPNATYPIEDASDVGDAWGLAGHAANPDAVRAKIKSIAKRLDLSHGLPDTAKDDAKPKEHTFPSPAASSFLPKSKIATLTTCWLEDGAISLNGRQYPRESVDRLIQSAQTQLSDPNAAPLTCYISHDAADADDSTKLVGKITAVWREATKAMATIDLANTHTGRDAATLAANGYLRTQSLRASNAEMKHEKGNPYPIVGGLGLRLDGIDFTATPGLQVARIQNVSLAESAEPQSLSEVFDIKASLLVESEKGTPMNDAEAREAVQAVQGAINEAMGNRVDISTTSGDSPSMTSDGTDDSYHQRMYQQPPMTSGQMQGMSASSGLMEAHDHVAILQGRSCAPTSESAAQAALREAGRALSAATHARLNKVHDALAKHLGMECEGTSRNASIDPDNDGDDDRSKDPQKNPDFGLDSMESARKGTKRPMSMEEASRLLEAAGYKIEKPKTEVELLREQLNELKAQVAAQKAPEPTPQRRSLVNGANAGLGAATGKSKVYTHGKYLRERLNSLDWEMLADRTAPLPEDINVELLIKEFEQLYAVQYDNRYGILSSQM